MKYLVSVLFLVTLVANAESEVIISKLVHDEDQETRDLQQVYTVDAYECDDQLNQVDVTEHPPHEAGRAIRVCLEPSEGNIFLRNISILKVDFFQYRNDLGVVQTVVENGMEGMDGGLSTVSCRPGGNTQVCSIETKLKNDFFINDGFVTGFGRVALQKDSLGGRQRELMDIVAKRQRRQTQQQSYVGHTNFRIEFQVQDAKKERKNHWVQQETHIQALFVLAILISFAICVCLCGASLCWDRCCGHETSSRRRSKEEPIKKVVVDETSTRSACSSVHA
jgi:hypothetical protein